MNELSRRHVIALGAAGVAMPNVALASTAREIGWEDLIPPGVPYSEIIGEGELDEVNDTWAPIFDVNATKLNEALNGELIRLPGFIIPLEQSAEGVTEFVLVPYVGACIHVPPPPPNQIVYAKLSEPYEMDGLFSPVWISGRMTTGVSRPALSFVDGTSEVATGYQMQVERVEPYE